MKKALILILFLATYLQGQSVSEKFDLAMKSYNSSQYVEANRLFNEFLREHNEIDELYSTAGFYSSMALLKTGNMDAAAVGFEYLIRNFIWSNFRDKSLYELGIIYFDQKNYSSCRTNLNTLLKEYPESEFSGSALYWIGESYTRENKLEEAVNFLVDAIQDKKNNKFIDYTIYTLASVYEKIGDYDNAVQYYDQLISYHKESPLANSARIRIGVCYFKLKDYQSSIIELNNPVLSGLPGDLYSESLYLLANSYYRVQEYGKAEKTYKEIIQNYPSASMVREVRYGLAWTYFQQKKYNDAYNIFNSLSDDTDTLAIKSFYWKGESKRYAGQESDALDIYIEFLKRFPDSKLSEGVQYQMGVIYFNSGNLEPAEKYLTTAINSYDNTVKVKAYTMLGEIALQRNEYPAAKEFFNNAVNIPDVETDLQNRALLGLGETYYFLNKHNDAVASLTEIDLREPAFEKDKLNFYLAENLFAMGDYQPALERYNKVDSGNKFFGNQALYGKAYCLFDLKKYDQSAESFSEFVKKYSSDKKIRDAKLRLADCYYATKNYLEASAIYKDIFISGKTGLDDPFTYYQYAQALYKGGDAPQALIELRNIQLKFPESEYADKSLYLIGWIKFQQNNYNGAISEYRNLALVYPNSSLLPLIYYSIGDAYYNIGDYDSSIVNYQRVLSGFPSSSYVFDAVNGIQYAYIAEGKPELAVSIINDFVVNNPKSNFADKLFFKKGEIYYSKKQYDKASISYGEFISAFPQSNLISDAYYWMGKSSENLGSNEEALKYFDKVFDNYPGKESAASAVIEMQSIYNNNKQYDAAINILNKSIDKLSQSPRLPELKFMKAETLINKGDINAAYDVFADIVQNSSGNLFAEKSKIELGLIDLTGGRYDNAAVYFKNLSESRNDELGAKAQFYLGVLYADQDQFPEAVTAFVRVKTVFSAYDEWLTRSYLQLGDVYLKMNDKIKAKEMFKNVLLKHNGDVYGKQAQSKIRTLR
ncbi:MAG: tetratricopeptide repeat protein [Ignavibacteriaceae bacterium]|nr:tetratricopeptide repeat protein [Ignavibacteriaceae bacterium]